MCLQRVSPSYHYIESCFQEKKQSDPTCLDLTASKDEFQILLNCEKLMFVFCTYNLVEQMYDCRKHIMFLPKWILNLQDLPRSQNPETVPICVA